MAPRTLYVTEREEWRAWLKANHAQVTEIWLIYYKKHTGQSSIPYNVAVEEALCFGWIDSTAKRIDDASFMQRFTPRRDTGNWSEPNKTRARRLIAERRMTEAGLSKISEAVLAELARPPAPRVKKRLVVPGYFKKAIAEDPQAWENFNKLAPTYRRHYVEWVAAAKRDETRAKRLRKARELLAKNEKLGIKRIDSNEKP
ncbi:MAG TPA: YdeI/OmpD-associated family protein [Blastocatellia bacterium]|nr:YdeI/OmpD-associated family protein [Blastocatellia bacterium]